MNQRGLRIGDPEPGRKRRHTGVSSWRLLPGNLPLL